MKRISYWASCHVKKAVRIIILLKVLLAALACYVGFTLYKMNLLLPAGEIYFTAVVVLLFVMAVYPKHKNFGYIRQVGCNFLLGLASFLTITSAVNNGDKINNGVYANDIIKNPTAQEILNSGKTREELTRREKRILKKEFFHQLKVYTKATLAGDKQKAAEAWKIIVAIVVFIGLLGLLAALACSLSCNGSEVAAILVGVLGLAGLLWALIAVIRRINKGPRPKEPAKE
jgi:protein-S-isoprenylcysteine O-methyltransferase Ste14